MNPKTPVGLAATTPLGGYGEGCEYRSTALPTRKAHREHPPENPVSRNLRPRTNRWRRLSRGLMAHTSEPYSGKQAAGASRRGSEAGKEKLSILRRRRTRMAHVPDARNGVGRSPEYRKGADMSSVTPYTGVVEDVASALRQGVWAEDG